MTNAQAQAEFMNTINNCVQLLEQLTAHVNNHIDVDSESVNYGNVGDVKHLEGALHLACEASGLPYWVVSGRIYKTEE